MKNTIILFLLAFGLSTAFTHHGGEKYTSNSGNIHFYSHTDIEDIEADNHKVKSAFLSSTGRIQFVALIKDFEFEKALMQEHFNENYMESTKYPKATFDGLIEDIESINLDKDGTYTSKVTGKLTMKDVTKEISTTGTFVVKGDIVNAKAKFIVHPEDYNITIPSLVKDKISKNIEVSVDIDYSHDH